MSFNKVDYSKTIIYKIISKDLSITDCYIGHTTNFRNRKNAHRQKSKSCNIQLYKFIRDNSGWDNFEMVEIEKYPCNNNNEARTRETYYYQLLNANLNKYKPLITDEEEKQNEKKRKQKEQYKNNQKIYRDTLSEERKAEKKLQDKMRKQTDYYKNYSKEYNKQYREKNGEIMNAKQKEKITCSCGAVISRHSKSSHERTLKHNSKNQPDI